MSFADELKQVQTNQDDLNRIKEQKRKERQEEYLARILSKCKDAAKQGKYYCQVYFHYDEGTYGNFAFGDEAEKERNADCQYLLQELKKKEYGFYSVHEEKSRYSDGYSLVLYISWSAEGNRLANEAAHPPKGCFERFVIIVAISLLGIFALGALSVLSLF